MYVTIKIPIQLYRAQSDVERNISRRISDIGFEIPSEF